MAPLSGGSNEALRRGSIHVCGWCDEMKPCRRADVPGPCLSSWICGDCDEDLLLKYVGDRKATIDMPLVWLIERPGNRAGFELWLGPVGISLTWPPRGPLVWNWGWWRG